MVVLLYGSSIDTVELVVRCAQIFDIAICITAILPVELVAVSGMFLFFDERNGVDPKLGHTTYFIVKTNSWLQAVAKITRKTWPIILSTCPVRTGHAPWSILSSKLPFGR